MEGDLNLFLQAAWDDQPNLEANPPDGSLSISLLKHQKIALAWMVQKELSGCPCHGGILADDQGLGKTVSTIALIVTERRSEENGGRKRNLPRGGTLIVCPSSLMKQWFNELGNKVAPETKLSVLVYHGCRRKKDPEDLAKYDIVITTYDLVAAAGPLSEVLWFRIVLDEAQTIKNHTTKKAMACYALQSQRRWCLSGTPIQNSIDDLYSYFCFTRCFPYSRHEIFLKTFKKAITENPVEGYKKLQAILKTMMLRRTKDTLLEGEPVVTLPPKSIELRKVEFTKEERDFYKKLERDAREQLKEYAEGGKRNSAQFLSMLTLLRQACNHPLLVSSSSVEEAMKSSSKTEAALDILVNVKRLGEKALVFSQWTKMLDLLEDALKSSSIKYRRFDGEMSVESKDRAIQSFISLPEVSVMLLSLKAASVGLNLVAANHVVMFDLWWNPTTEDQAIDRCHRIGQTRPVHVVRLTVKDTIEDRILSLQEKKRSIVSSTFGEGNDMGFSQEDFEFLCFANEEED